MGGRRIGRARAIAWPSRLWWGGRRIRSPRDKNLIEAVVQFIRQCAAGITAGAGGYLSLLGGVEGLSPYLWALKKGFRHPLYPHRPGSPRREAEDGPSPLQTNCWKRACISWEWPTTSAGLMTA